MIYIFMLLAHIPFLWGKGSHFEDPTGQKKDVCCICGLKLREQDK